MRIELQYVEYALIHVIALIIAIALIGAPGPARSGALEPYAEPYPPSQIAPLPPHLKAPRWSNQHHLDAARAVRDHDCATRPDYVPGVDAWGDPVIPADLPRRYRQGEGLPLGVYGDIQLPQRTIGKYPLDLSAGDIYYDLNNKQLSTNGVPWVKDCIPPTK